MEHGSTAKVRGDVEASGIGRLPAPATVVVLELGNRERHADPLEELVGRDGVLSGRKPSVETGDDLLRRRVAHEQASPLASPFSPPCPLSGSWFGRLPEHEPR